MQAISAKSGCSYPRHFVCPLVENTNEEGDQYSEFPILYCFCTMIASNKKSILTSLFFPYVFYMINTIKVNKLCHPHNKEKKNCARARGLR